MRIKRIRLKNGYKRFLDLTIELGDSPARIIALVGPNGCGKSSVLDGLLFHARAYERIGSVNDNRDYTYHSMNRIASYDYTNVEIEFTNGSFETVRNAKAKSGKQNTIFSFRSPYRYNSNLKIHESRATAEIRLNDYGAGNASSLDDKMEENYRRLFAKYNKYRDDNDLKPSDAKAKIIGDLNASIGNCIDLEIHSLGNIEAGQGTLYFRKSGQMTEFDFNVLSSGEKEVIDILLDLYLRADDYADTIFLLDEPELHISTSIQRNLLIEINRLIGPDCQVWLTTHSIGFLRALQSEMKAECQIIHFRNEYELAKNARTLTPMKASAVAWRELFSIALDDLAELVSPKQIIYCEGRDMPGANGAERGMDAKVLNNIFAENYPEALFVSSGGNTELDQRSTIAIAILGKVFPTVEIMLLKDRDMASGKPTTEADRQKYLADHPDNHRVLKRWEIENYLYDKEVLVQYCAANGLPFDETAYDAFVNDIENQNVKDETGKIKASCGVTTSISKDAFKLALSDFVNTGSAVYAELENCIFKRI